MDMHEISREGALDLCAGYPPTLKESGSNPLTNIEFLMAE
jgi:hypothetical protein